LVVDVLSNVVVPNKGGVLVVARFSFVVIGVGDTIGVIPNNGRTALVDTGVA